MASTIKHIFAVSWTMPPMLFPRAIQVSRLLAALSRRGWQISVISGDPNASPGEITVDNFLEQVYLTSYTQDRIPYRSRNSTIPDPILEQWRGDAFQRACEIINQFPISHLMTFGQPWVDHLVGLDLRQKYHVPWLAHFSDPWVDNPYYEGISSKTMLHWKKLERSVVRSADQIIFTNSQAADLVMRKYSKPWRKKAWSIPHGYDRSLLPVPKNAKNTGPLKLVHTGDIYGRRSPVPLIDAVQILVNNGLARDQIQIHLLGTCSQEFRTYVKTCGLEDMILVMEKVPYQQSLSTAQGADVMLLIDAPSKNANPFLPSKLIDYLMFEKPILGLTPLMGASADLLLSIGCQVVSPDDPTAISSALMDLLSRRNAGELTIGEEFKKIALAYDINTIAVQVEEKIIQARYHSHWFWN
jgi:glycosyltransferase involved in cell wall biosynthesis